MDNPAEVKHLGTARIQKEMLDRGLCTVCGACVGYCPHPKTFEEQVTVIHDCKLCALPILGYQPGKETAFLREASVFSKVLAGQSLTNMTFIIIYNESEQASSLP